MKELNVFLQMRILQRLCLVSMGLWDRVNIQIMVNNTDFEKANKIIDLDQSKESLKCPNCHSENITYGLGSNKIKKIFVIIMSLFAFTPFSNLKNTYYCKNCKIEFRK